MNIAVIPARGGSKRIPRKNIRTFAGKPMILWSIEAALKSGCFDQVLVSTDDQEIAEVAIKNGADVPFMRPRELADDLTSASDVVRHAINFTYSEGKRPSYVCCILGAAPLVQSRDLKKGYEIIKEGNLDYVFSATSYPYPIQRAFYLATEGVEMFNPQFYHARSQDLIPAYHDAGQFYWGTPEAWLQERQVFARSSRPVMIPRSRSQDVDTEEDWEMAELLKTAILQKSKTSMSSK